jgi:hypothetical protein
VSAQTPTTDRAPLGPTGLCHQSTAAIDEAADWLTENRATCNRALIPAIRERFGLTSSEAIEVLVQAGRRARARSASR